MISKRILYPAVFIVVMLIYCLFIARMGYEEWDTGFISGLSWRIVNGEVMYEDFIYTKPPVTPYFNSLFISILPEEGQFYYIRCINYLLFGIQVIFTVFAVDNLYKIRERLKINLWGIIIVGFIVSYLNVSPYPWYTQDGLLFVSVALWLKSRHESPTFYQTFFIALFATVSALSKQSFYLIPFIFLAWMFIDYGIKKALWFFGTLILLAGVFLFIISLMTSIPNFISLVTGQTHLQDLYHANIYGYAHKHSKLYAVILVLSLLAGINYKAIKQTDYKEVLKWFIFFQMLAGMLFFILREPGLGTILFFNGCMSALLYHYFVLKKSIKYLFPLLVILITGWSASVSWGYPYPVFYLTGIILVCLILIKDLTGMPLYKFYTVSGIAISLIAISYNYTPYRSPDIGSLNYSMETVSPKLKYIYADKLRFERFSELKELVNKYKGPYMVTTNYSAAHYLFNTHNPASADWMINSEINFQLDKILKEAAAGNGYIFLEKEYDPVLEGGGPMHKSYSLFSQFVEKNLTPVERSGYFTVYNAKQLHEILH